MIVPSISYDAKVSTPTIRLLAEGLSATDEIELHVFSLRYPPALASGTHGSVAHHAIDGARMRFRTLASRAVQAIRREHARHPFDVLHALWLQEPGIIAVLAGMAMHVPVIASIGGAEVARLPVIGYGGALTRRGRFVSSLVLRRARVVTGGSTYVLALARTLGAGRTPLRLAPLPVDSTHFCPVSRRSGDPTTPRLFHAASLIPVKDQTTLLRAFRLIADRHPTATLDIAGEDPFGHRLHLETLRHDLELNDRVRFLGSVRHQELPGYYRNADLFLLSSQHESQGMVVLEAAACGTPTIGTAVGVVPDLAPDAAMSVPPSDPGALAAATLDLLSQPGLLRHMGSRARERVETEYAIGPSIERFMALYRELSHSGHQ